eukprot:3158810-Pyramimonas_sp.AAC.1
MSAIRYVFQARAVLFGDMLARCRAMAMSRSLGSGLPQVPATRASSCPRVMAPPGGDASPSAARDTTQAPR